MASARGVVASTHKKLPNTTRVAVTAKLVAARFIVNSS
jgi:hypothetical protein